MPKQYKLPVVSGEKLVSVLERFGYKKIHQRGSHIKMRKFYEDSKHTITVPNHKEIDKGTLSAIINRLAPYLNITEIINLLGN